LLAAMGTVMPSILGRRGQSASGNRCIYVANIHLWLHDSTQWWYEVSLYSFHEQWLRITVEWGRYKFVKRIFQTFFTNWLIVEGINLIPLMLKKKGKAILVTGREGPWGCETIKLQHFLDNRLTDGGEVVGLTRRFSFTPQEDSWYSFLLEAETTPEPYCGWKD
jgi:hypothetical protein